MAAKWRATRWWGVDIGDPEIVVWGSPIELGAQDRVRLIRDKLLRTKLLPAFEMSEPSSTASSRRSAAFRPRMLFGYPSAFAHIARHARAAGQRLDDLGIHVAFVTSERLYDEQRELIAAPSAARWPTATAGATPASSPTNARYGGMHISARGHHRRDRRRATAACCRRASPARSSSPTWRTRDFPFIRYRTGDVGVLDDEDCDCGRGLPMLKEIQGRTTDFVVAADGTVMHGLALIYIVRDLPGVKQFKIVQESLDADPRDCW